MRRTIRGGVLLSLPSTKHITEITDISAPVRTGLDLTGAKPCLTEGAHVRTGCKLAEQSGLPILSPITGTVRIEDNTLWVENDGQDGGTDDPIAETALPLDRLTPADLISAVRQAGIPDSAGRPLWQKLERAAGKIYLAAVCALDTQPGGGLSSVLAALRADTLISALKLILVVFSAGQGRVILSFSDRRGYKAIRDAVGGFSSRIRIQQVLPAYPAQSERPLFSLLTGKELSIRKSPEEAGVLILTPAELLAVADLFFEGRRYTRTYVSVDGDGVREPLLLRVPVGMRIDQLPGIGDRLRHTRIVENGLMSGHEIRPDAFVRPATHALSVIRPQNSPSPDRCMGCDACFAACPMYLSPRMILSADRRDDSPLARFLTDNPLTGTGTGTGGLRPNAACCIGCGCCSYVCPAHLPLAEGMARLRDRFRPEGRENAPDFAGNHGVQISDAPVPAEPSANPGGRQPDIPLFIDRLLSETPENPDVPEPPSGPDAPQKSDCPEVSDP